MGRPEDILRDMAQQFDGTRILGGCDDCDAYQTMEMVEPTVAVIHIHHDDDCPTLARHQGTGQ
jgi:hypothetical protein